MESELSKLTAEIVAFKQTAGHSFWQIGARLVEIRDKKLYLEKFGTWSDYLRNAVDISERSAYQLMRISENFPAAQVKEWGHSKLDLLLRLEKPQQDELLTIHKPTDTVQDLRQAVREIQEREMSPPMQFKVMPPLPDSAPLQLSKNDFFFKAEMVLSSTLPKVMEAKDHLVACSLDPAWATYQRRTIIENMWKNIQIEVNR